MNIVLRLIQVLLPTEPGAFWTSVSAIATLCASAIALSGTRRKIAISANFCCGKIYKDQSVKLIQIRILNKGTSPVYISYYGINIFHGRSYSEVIDPNHAPFYYCRLPVIIAPGEEKELWLNFDCFYSFVVKSNFTSAKARYRCAVLDSYGKVWYSKTKISFAELARLKLIPNEETTKYSTF